jgi:hypothetical protein
MVLLPCSRVLFESFRCSLKKNLCNTRVYVYDDDDDDAIILERVTLRVRIANWTGEDSRCRGGIVHIRGGCSCVRGIRRHCSTALWRFRASTSNSLSGRAWPHVHTPIRNIYHTYAQQDIRVCGDDHFQPHKRQYDKSKAL